MAALLRTAFWLIAAGIWAYLKKPADAGWLQFHSGAAGWLGGLILGGGWALHVWSNATLGRAEAQASPAPPPLVTDGPFQFVRNPIYLAGGLIFLGIYVVWADWRPIDAVALIAPPLVFHLLVVRVEEPELLRRFGQAYAEYCRLVPRWVPRLPWPASHDTLAG